MFSGGKLMSYSEDFSNLPSFDMEEALKSCMGKISFVEELCLVFVRESLPMYLPGLKKGIQNKNLDDITKSAHGIKGGCAVIGLIRAREMAYTIEMASKTGDLSGVEEVMPLLEAELDEVVNAIKLGKITKL
jgi:HPt (histidine-containing phosphotransfer) domain-containing protein